MTESENIFIFVPNIIGYARVILALISFYFMSTNHVIAICCYVTSALLDAFDGHAARYFNQSTKFGAILDQLTDRVGTMCLMANLSHFYPDYSFWFLVSMTIDIACHWIYLHTSLLQGKTSHKFIDMSENPIMSVYYNNRTVLFIMCSGNEAFYAALYVLHFTEGPILVGISLFKAICIISAPIALVKTILSLIHGYVACRNLAIIDVKEREQLRKVK
ncbi:CDP-diacylglycerol--inositol 3-phosphatidyltransferase [Belonocnema kinseyi]|uniref:CDP-diacylglycerol--inositol 3-phosphatidyltransferase n=1 Tax=Belonocnema kinseyi TaxID=2817044 RepID=UPI00143DA376|nr:CDP-diacylglycerol--inositol 3-phosphatidyltransferase [Belonocnema kinseyi]XP_033216062.1 CDP-diacylglycerol--inositol 3-phosphatidyltransferase [Belonocnema kinseyi]XP_033216063.1 CDP-diacylglycerol--inositol 3-phosphatidyltransferase [Belonocnema kinseyi]